MGPQRAGSVTAVWTGLRDEGQVLAVSCTSPRSPEVTVGLARCPKTRPPPRNAVQKVLCLGPAPVAHVVRSQSQHSCPVSPKPHCHRPAQGPGWLLTPGPGSGFPARHAPDLCPL